MRLAACVVAALVLVWAAAGFYRALHTADEAYARETAALCKADGYQPHTYRDSAGNVLSVSCNRPAP